MALVSVAFHRGQMCVVGMDSHAVRGHDEIEMLLMDHIEGLREIWCSAWFIFVGESNLGQETDHMRHMLRSCGYVYCVCEKGVAGVRTTNQRKELYAMELCKFVSQQACLLEKRIVVKNRFLDAGSRKQETLENLRKQLIGFRKLVLKSTSGRSEPRVSYTGKSQGAQDDLVVTMSIAAYWGVQFLSKRIPGVPYDEIASV